MLEVFYKGRHQINLNRLNSTLIFIFVSLHCNGLLQWFLQWSKIFLELYFVMNFVLLSSLILASLVHIFH